MKKIVKKHLNQLNRLVPFSGGSSLGPDKGPSKEGHFFLLLLLIFTGCSSTDDGRLRVERVLGWDSNPVYQDVTGYKLYFGTESSDYNGECVLDELGSPVIIRADSLSDPTMPQYTFEDFNKTTGCFFAISSFNKSFESEKSPKIRFIPAK